MNANKSTLAELVRALDTANLDTCEPHTFKLLPNGELTIKSDIINTGSKGGGC